jgi:hypothetical protein
MPFPATPKVYGARTDLKSVSVCTEERLSSRFSAFFFFLCPYNVRVTRGSLAGFRRLRPPPGINISIASVEYDPVLRGGIERYSDDVRSAVRRSRAMAVRVLMADQNLSAINWASEDLALMASRLGT